METLLKAFFRMVQHARREPVEFDADATVRIETRLLDLASRDHGTFPYLP
jgi:hypothetical protein